MKKEEKERFWRKILQRSCVGDFNCMINERNPFYNNPTKGPKCPFLVNCRAVGKERRERRKLSLSHKMRSS
jgi:hypothetical protein